MSIHLKLSDFIDSEIRAAADNHRRLERILLTPDEFLPADELAEKRAWHEEASKYCHECGRPWADK